MKMNGLSVFFFFVFFSMITVAIALNMACASQEIRVSSARAKRIICKRVSCDLHARCLPVNQ